MLTINLISRPSTRHNTCQRKSLGLLHFPATSNHPPVTYSEIVTNKRIKSFLTWGGGKVPARLDSKALPLGWILNPEKGDSLSERILARLVQSQAHELNPSLKLDYHQAWLTVHFAAQGNPIAFIEASYRVHGCHPEKFWPRLVANRKALLGKDYSLWYDANDMPQAAEPLNFNVKKPPQSTRKEDRRNAA